MLQRTSRCSSWIQKRHKEKKKVKPLSHFQLFGTPWTVAYQTPPSMEFSGHEQWSGLPFPSPGDLPDPGIKPSVLRCRQMPYYLSHQGSKEKTKEPEIKLPASHRITEKTREFKKNLYCCFNDYAKTFNCGSQQTMEKSSTDRNTRPPYLSLRNQYAGQEATVRTKLQYVKAVYCHSAYLTYMQSSVQSLSHIQIFATPWTAEPQASLSISNSWNLLTLMAVKSVMPSNHLILCHPLFLLPSFPASGSFPMSQFFSSGDQSIGVSASASVLPVNIQD